MSFKGKRSGMSRMNCWEFKKCGRQPGGMKVSELGVCPAAANPMFDGVHGGKNGGRACWVLAGTFCGGVVQGTFAHKLSNCIKCEFYQNVRSEEAKGFRTSSDLLGLK